MPGEFDMESAVTDIGSGLGFGDDSSGGGDDDVVLDVEAKEIPDAPVVEEPAATTAEKPAETPEPAAATDAPPKTWRKEASAHWAALPSEIKAEVLKRESDIFAGLETYKADAGFGKSIKAVVAPYEQILRANNMDPAQTIGGLMNAHYTLATGTPEARVQLFQKLAKDYGIDLGQLSGQPAGEAPYIDPAVAALQKELQTVQSQLSATAQQQHQQRRAEVSRQVDVFAADPKNVHWNDVADDITRLISTGVAGTLQEAYDKAVWLNPVTRAKEVTRTAAEATSKAQAEAKAKADKAKAAMAANVHTKARNGSAATPLGSLDDTLEASLASIRSRG